MFDRYLAWTMCSAVTGLGAVVVADDPSPVQQPSVSAQVAMTPAQPPVVTRPRSGKTTIAREADGLFYLNARVNGVAIRFLIDTGSTAVVLRPDDAMRLGLDAADTGGDMLETAGGSVAMRWAKARKLEVAGLKLHDVPVAIPSAGPVVSLLGASVLREAGPMLIDGDRMVLGTSQS